MPETGRQALGRWGETQVVQHCKCPRCKRDRSLKPLPRNFKCADVICEFCGYLAQVKTSRVKDVEHIPASILGAAWDPQKERMDAGIYFPLFLVLRSPIASAIYYLSADLQPIAMFVARKALRPTAKRHGWKGFLYDLRCVPAGAFVRLH
ncbi:MAG: DpnI domain-containing protein [Sulfobacillus sp.]